MQDDIGLESLLYLLNMADEEVENEDFVTLSRGYDGDFMDEHLVTFSGIFIKRRVVRHASDAEAFRKGEKNSYGTEESSGNRFCRGQWD